MKNLTEEDIQSAVEDSAKFANFCQAFKMKWWENYSELSIKIPEKYLDELAIIAYELLK